ncbi:MAG TPA: hypothetical protein VFW62_03880, partial [bacterium]|nr:hypothetical protein [bacterium]
MVFKLAMILLWTCWLATPALADAPGPAAEAPALEVESVPESRPTGPYGEILFFPEDSSRPADERHRVTAGQKIDLCIRLSANASAFLEQLQEKAIGFQLLMEDSA